MITIRSPLEEATAKVQTSYESDSPASPSIDFMSMAPYWSKVRAIMGGTDSMRAMCHSFLPKHKHESTENYKVRCELAKHTNIYSDIISNLAQRPFAKEVSLEPDSSSPLAEEFIVDVDGKGSTLHTFSGDVFYNGIDKAIDWILIDYTKSPGDVTTQTVEQEKASGVRPFWVRYSADQIIDAQSDIINGREQFTHVRIYEVVKKRDGYREKEVPQIREFTRDQLDDGSWSRPYWQIHQRVKAEGKSTESWEVVEGPFNLTIDEIPLVPFICGRREGKTWVIKPAMEAAADLQIELFQQESGLKHISTMGAFPMLAGNGVSPPLDEKGNVLPVPVGPMAALFAPPEGATGDSGEWVFIEPAATVLNFLSGEVEATKKELRELGRQPLTAQSGNLTVITTAYAAKKGNAAIQAWALNLAFALDRCFYFTGLWQKSPELSSAKVRIDTDFDLGFGDDESFTHVLALRKQNDISRDAEIDEAKRRGILSPEYDPDKDLERILSDMEGDPEETDDSDDPETAFVSE